MKIKCLIFDMDGLMIDSERLAFKIVAEILQERGHHFPLAKYIRIIGNSQEQSEGYFARNFRGIDPKRDLYDVFYPRYFEALKLGRLVTKPGLLPLLGELDKRKIKRAVASSSKKQVVETSLKCIGVFNRMDAVVYPEMVEKVKPCPDLFLKAAALLEAEPEECLVLEDSTAGIEAAIAAGMPVIAIPDLAPLSRNKLKACLFKFNSLFDVLNFVRAYDINGQPA